MSQHVLGNRSMDIETVDSPIRSTAELARHLGLSRWTVSRVLNGHAGVHPHTRERVLQGMLDSGFEPNRLARGLRGAASQMIGICFQHLESPILARKNTVLQQQLTERGYRGVFEMTDGDAVLESAVIRHFRSIRVDGLILVGSMLEADSPVVEQLLAENLPVVALDPIHSLPFPTVMLNRLRAMELKVRHLHALGHRSFALLGFASDQWYRSARMEGLRRAADQLGLDPPEEWVSLHIDGWHVQDYAYGAALGAELLKLHESPQALIALNDRIAVGAMRALQAAGRKIPADYSIIGFDNLEVSAWTDPPLSTVDQSIEKLMGETIEQLMRRIAAKSTGDKAGDNPAIWLQPRLIERASTGNFEDK